MNKDLQVERAQLILREWMHVRPGEQVLIVTDERHADEAASIQAACKAAGATGVVMAVDSELALQGRMGKIVDGAAACADVIIGATHISIATTTVKSTGEAHGARMVSLPMAVNDGISILEATFTSQNISEAKEMSQRLYKYFAGASEVRVTTVRGTDLTLDIRGREIFSTEDAATPGKFISASFELSVAPVEPHTNGTVILDGSMGYPGLVDEPVRLSIENGRVTAIAANPSGQKLQAYMDAFGDPQMFGVAEFGIGLNRQARCAGKSYVEDESAYGTFHLGFGRNLAIGGQQDAISHFDLVTLKPDVYVDGKKVMAGGEICV